MKLQQEELRHRLMALGFEEVRFARLADVPAAGLTDWLGRGFQADMTWMERTAAKRLDPRLVLPGARSVIMLGVNYWPGKEGERGQSTAGSPVWARYTRYEDYHDTFKPALVTAGRVIEEFFGVRGTDYRYYADTGPVLERGWAERAGLGFLGKNGMLISRRFGNWLLLAAILTRVELEADGPLRARIRSLATGGRTGLLCGKCVRCIAACPTQAIPEPGLIDARRCISYQTIENKGMIPRELRRGVGEHIYGCDVCLEVCPWNRFARAGRRLLLAARFEITALTLRELLELTATRFAEVFRRTPIKRLRLTGLLRNACVVAGNVAVQAGTTHDLVAPLRRLAEHPAPIVRAHAVWAVQQITGAEATELLAAARANETDPVVTAEYEAVGRLPGAGES
jgi:epoxyqueuosine reductase